MKSLNPYIILHNWHITLLFFIAALLGYNTSYGESLMSQEEKKVLLKKLEELIGIQFPKGTTLIRYERQTESDALIRAKLTFTSSQWESFVSTSPLNPDIFEEEQRYLLGTNIEWWNPQDSKKLPTAQVWLPNAKVLNVGVDKSNSKEFLVFLVWHGT